VSAALFVPTTDGYGRLAKLHATCFAQAWTQAAIAGLLATPNCYAFATEHGFVMARAAAGEAEILTLAVAPSRRRQGVGRALVRAAAAHAQRLGASTMFLEAAADNAAALALYAGLGFATAGLRPGYYNGGDALLLKALLPLPCAGDIA
jgi:ribosomal-protein-alanine N-acetyltransferase